jgi:hypothetical protein
VAADIRRRPPSAGIAQKFHRQAEALATDENIFLGDAFNRLREQEPDLYDQWWRETSYPDEADTLQQNRRERAKAIRDPEKEQDEEKLVALAASQPFKELHARLIRLLEVPKRKGRQRTLSDIQNFHNRLSRRGVRLTVSELHEVLNRLGEAGDRVGRGAAFEVRYRRALKAREGAKSATQQARRFTDTMLARRTRSGPKPTRNALRVVQTYLALTTGVVRSSDPVVSAAWRGKTYADYDLEPPPIPESLRQRYREPGLQAPKHFERTQELHIPVSRRDAIAIVARHFRWKNPDSCVKFLERSGVAGLPGDRER